ncbi:MAG: MltA domain-containing protein [Gammaproteobacteria bacterium]|nr:MltA domain-containing protein [Gammaproteobacteria bacterium]MBU0826366.1 MltA domain-containing protein [Gammaproteobacteria bacterium]MBU0890108.1 MltA domain-containing protein [Gammaproteobacteria bacterium]MBU1352953.1 MltA domain-containing protein [Gammaproteobacteria bacterium]MBU1505987.1 MltA domain-containing protein [Gammaproteobacteria bacterium]
MVHHTMATSSASASSASSKISPMKLTLLRIVWTALIVGTLAACSTPPAPSPSRPAAIPLPPPTGTVMLPGDTGPLPPPLSQPKSRWIAVRWGDLPGFTNDALHEAWNAWIKSCERPAPPFTALCGEVRQLSIATADEQRAWLMARLQPYRIEAPDGNAEGLLTAYYEPMVDAARQPGNGFTVPVYRPPATLGSRKPWYTRQQIETLPEAQAALQGRAIAWLRDPVESMVLHIQGSGRLRITEADGSVSSVRVAYAGTNDQPYQSVGRWLLDQGATRDATWPGIRAWLNANPHRTNELLWSNPRYVFFREEPLSGLDAEFGPKGAQGVPLTPGRSIAVDRQSIPYGTPVWLASTGPQVQLSRLVLAQDTGSAILGAVRADFFTGWGQEAGDIAGRLKQGLRLWALWPK